MKSPGFWWKKRSLRGALLSPLSLITKSIADGRLKEGERSNIPVICIGNFVVGGAGKTPVALAFCDWFLKQGKSAVFLTRGYGGRLKGPHQVVEADTAKDVGDEPLLLCQKAPVVVAKDKRAGVRFIEDSLDADIIIMDDGFQSGQVKPHISVVVMDDGRGVGNGHVFPAGPLRAGLDKQIEKADVLLILSGDRDSAPSTQKVEKAFNDSGKPVFKAKTKLVIDEGLKAGPLVAYCGIGHPQKFFDAIDAAGLEMALGCPFDDHQPYGKADAKNLMTLAKRFNAKLVTTEKDYARMKGVEGTVAKLREQSHAIPLKLDFENPDEMGNSLTSSL